MKVRITKIKQVFQAEDTPEIGFAVEGELTPILIGKPLKVGDYETKTPVMSVPKDNGSLVVTKNSFYTIVEI